MMAHNSPPVFLSSSRSTRLLSRSIGLTRHRRRGGGAKDDDAIILIENSLRRRERGERFRSALSPSLSSPSSFTLSRRAFRRKERQYVMSQLFFSRLGEQGCIGTKFRSTEAKLSKF